MIQGKVVRFEPAPELKIPHMGWNTVEMEREVPLLQGIRNGDFFYFVHSYYVVPEEDGWAATLTPYGKPFVWRVWKGNIFATQVHPDKSQQKGLNILENFARSI